jgi:hypothetical protein
MMSFVSVCLTGCGRSSVVIIPAGEPVQLAEPVKARIILRLPDGTSEVSKVKATIPAGWWALPDPE